MSALDTYAPDRIGYRYGTRDSAYSKGYHRGQDVRKLNEAGTASVVTDVDAIDDGTVVYVGRPNGLLARTVVIDTGRARGRYESHSHMADISVGVGQRVSSGDRLGRNASMGEDHGFIDGVHDHVTITDRFDGAWVTWLGEYDPLPYMEAAYQRARQIASGSLAGAETKEWDEMATRDEVKAAMREALDERSFGAASIVPLTDGGIYLVSGITGRHAHIENPYHLTLIQRAFKNNSNDMMAGAELAIVRGYLTAVNPPPLAEVDTAALAAKLGEIDNDADAATIEAAVKRVIASAVTEIRLTTQAAQ